MFYDKKDFSEPIIKSIKNIYKLLRRMYKILLTRTYLKKKTYLPAKNKRHCH